MMNSANWMQQGFDLLLSLKKARPMITPDTLLETCLGHLLLFTLAEEVCWIEKDTFFATCINQQQKAPEKNFRFHHEEQGYLLDLKDTGSVDRELTSRSPGKTLQNFVVPIKTRHKKGCYVLSFTEGFAANDHFYSFLDICQQALTDLQEIFDGQMRYAKLKVRFNGILKSLPHGIVFLDDEGYYCWVNENAAQLLAIPAGTVEPALVHTAMAEFRSRASNAVEIEVKKRSN
jgi:PAS domain-containing protein